MVGTLLEGHTRTEALLSLEANGWAFADNTLSKGFVFADFSAAMGWMVQVAMVAEKLDHHPEWTNIWNRVDVHLTTHRPKGFSTLDVALAQAMDKLFAPAFAPAPGSEATPARDTGPISPA